MCKYGDRNIDKYVGALYVNIICLFLISIS